MLEVRGGSGGQPRRIADDQWAAPLRKHICMPQVDDSAQAQTVDVFARAGQGPGVGVGCNNMAHAALRQQSGDEHTSELQSLMRISYAVFCLKKKKKKLNF